jgi:hypothetical protein
MTRRAGRQAGRTAGRPGRPAAVLALAALVALGPPSAFGADTRFGIDPRWDLADLTRSGRVAVSVERRGGLYTVGASAVLAGDLPTLLAVSTDYERYVGMGMPHLLEMRVVSRAPDGDHLSAWTWMRYLGRSSKHYVAVHIQRDVQRPAGSAPAAGVTWTLAPRAPTWPHEEASVFARLDGSWYLEDLAEGRVYVRYAVAVVLDSSVPEALLAPMLRHQLGEGARAGLRTVAREADARRASPAPQQARKGRS